MICLSENSKIPEIVEGGGVILGGRKGRRREEGKGGRDAFFYNVFPTKIIVIKPFKGLFLVFI